MHNSFGKQFNTVYIFDEDIKKRWQEYTEEIYKKDLHNPDNHDGMIIHLEQDILNAKSSGP